MEWLNYHHLLYFWAVAKEGSITRAAERLGLSVQTISTQLGQRDRVDALGDAEGQRAGVHHEQPVELEVAAPGRSSRTPGKARRPSVVAPLRQEQAEGEQHRRGQADDHVQPHERRQGGDVVRVGAGSAKGSPGQHGREQGNQTRGRQ